MSPVLEDFAAQVQAGFPSREGFFGGGDWGGCTGRGAPSEFFSLLPNRRFCRFSPVPPQAAGVGRPRPGQPGHCGAERPQILAVNPERKRLRDPNSIILSNNAVCWSCLI